LINEPQFNTKQPHSSTLSLIVVVGEEEEPFFLVNMAAEVSSLVRLSSGYKDDRNAGSEPGGAKSTALITRDLLGGATLETESLELDLDLQVPSGWEKRLDLKVIGVLIWVLLVS
jgi:hypothetical protein